MRKQLLLSLFMFLGSSLAHGQSLVSYSNERYGFSLTYPDDLQMDPPADNGDGRHFSSASGISISVFGGNNILDETVATTTKSLLSRFDEVSYRAKGKNWFVLSGYKGDKVLNIKGFVGKGSTNELWIEYPKSLTKQFSSFASKIVASFKPGELNESH